MFLIKECPSCSRRVRFPIDKGKIRVRCTCGYDFIADPDEPALYKNARFDLRHDEKNKPGLYQHLRKRLERVDIGKTPETLITGLLSIKYKLQNFRLLPAAEQRRITVIAVIIILALVLLGYLLFGGSAVPEDGSIFL